MIKATHIGIWMDHANAHLIEYKSDPVLTTTIESGFSHQEPTHDLGKNENLSHNKEQHQQSEYYKRLGEIVKKYTDVILFGPTNAKVELLNTLKADHRFEKIKIEIKQADKMTENQQHAFVKEYFSKH